MGKVLYERLLAEAEALPHEIGAVDHFIRKLYSPEVSELEDFEINAIHEAAANRYPHTQEEKAAYVLENGSKKTGPIGKLVEKLVGQQVLNRVRQEPESPLRPLEVLRPGQTRMRLLQTPERRLEQSRIRKGRAVSKYGVLVPPSLDPDTTFARHAVYTVIAEDVRDYGRCSSSVMSIARRAGCSKTTAKDAISRAAGHKWIEVEHRPIRPGYHATNIIRIADERWIEWIERRSRKAYKNPSKINTGVGQEIDPHSDQELIYKKEGSEKTEDGSSGNKVTGSSPTPEPAPKPNTIEKSAFDIHLEMIRADAIEHRRIHDADLHEQKETTEEEAAPTHDLHHGPNESQIGRSKLHSDLSPVRISGRDSLEASRDLPPSSKHRAGRIRTSPVGKKFHRLRKGSPPSSQRLA